MLIEHRSDLHLLLDFHGLTGDVAEVGVAQGLHARDLCRKMTGRKIYLVDAWQPLRIPGDAASAENWHEQNFAAVQQLAAEYPGRAIVLRGLSDQMASRVPDGSLAMVYLDACHYEPHVTNDLMAWLPKLQEGGIFAGHDYLAPEYDVRRAVDSFARNVRVIAENQPCDAGFWFTKEDTV